MRGNQEVIAECNAALRAELSAIVQYMVQAEMLNNNGYKKLGDYVQKRAIHEMRHAEKMIERIIFLDGTPDVSVGLQPHIVAKVQQQFEADLNDEKDAIRQYNNAAHVCDKAGDAGTKEIFEHMVQDEEGHADWLEAQLDQISQIGIQNYLAQQLG